MNQKNQSKKELIHKAILRIKKENSIWISFFQGAIHESISERMPVTNIVKREFKKLREEIPDLPSNMEEVTTRFIKDYAETHFNLELQ